MSNNNGNKKHRPYLTNNEVSAIYSWAKEQVRANPDNYIAIDIESAFRKLLAVNSGTQMHTSMNTQLYATAMPQQQVVNVNDEMEELYKSFKQEPSNLGQDKLLALMDWCGFRLNSHPLTDAETFIMIQAGNSKAAQELNYKLYGTREDQDKVVEAFAEAGRNTPKTRNPFDL